MVEQSAAVPAAIHAAGVDHNQATADSQYGLQILFDSGLFDHLEIYPVHLTIDDQSDSFLTKTKMDAKAQSHVVTVYHHACSGSS
jgi:hypothetical protein